MQGWPKGRKKTSEHIAAQTAWLKEAWRDPEFRRRQTERQLGNSHATGKGQAKTETWKQMMRKKFTGRPSTWIGPHTPESRAAISRANKGRARPDVVIKNRTSEHIAAVQKSLHLRPNKPESHLLKILDREFPWHWRYSGDGSFVLAGKCPDFVNVNGVKAVIEMFGDYWHRNDDPDARVQHFAQVGYRCVVIWEGELKHPRAVLGKIRIALY